MSTLTALSVTESKLYAREWGMLVFAFAFPPLMMLILAGVFAGEGFDEVWGAADGTDYYIASYLGIPLASVALTGLPVMLASYRELGILRRFEVSGVKATTVVTAQALVSLATVGLGAVLVLVIAAPVYGVPAVEDPLGVLAVLAVGSGAMLTLGVALGLALRTSRAANAIGMLLFLPMFILGGGGPPAGVMTSAMSNVADLLPLTHITEGLRQAWLFGDLQATELWWLAGWWAVALLLVALVARTRRTFQ